MKSERTESVQGKSPSGFREALEMLRAGKAEQAETCVRKLLLDSPRDPALHQLAAAIALADGRYADSGRWALSCLEIHPEHVPVMLIAGRAARAAGHLVQAMDWFRRAGRVAPANPEPAFQLCAAQIEGGDPAAALTLKHALDNFPDFAEGWRDIGRAFYKAGQMEAAVVAFARAAAHSSDPVFNVHHGSALMAAGRPAAAILAFRAALAASPDCAEAMLPLAQCLRLTGAARAAHETLAHLSGLQPRNGTVFFALGLVCDDLHDVSGAVAAYRRCLELQPDLPEAHVNLGLALQQTGQLELAISSYRAAVRLRADTFGRISQALTSAGKGQMWLDLGRLRRSLAG